jgi:putative hemolysin
MRSEDKFIDLEKLIASKNPALAKWAPGFLIRYLKRILHVDEVNAFMHQHREAAGYEFSQKVIEKFNIRVVANGFEKIPREGGVIIAMNHPLGGMDAMAMITQLYPIRQDFKFVVNDVLLHLKNLNEFFVGVNKHGSNTKQALLELNELYASDHAMLVFPAGLVSRRKRGKVEDLEWKKTFVTRARKYQRNVIPVHIEGSLTSFFYRLANLRTGLGIKANIEMLYLPDELFQQNDQTLTLTVGDPIPYETFDRSKTDLEWAQWVKARLYALPPQK